MKHLTLIRTTYDLCNTPTNHTNIINMSNACICTHSTDVDNAYINTNINNTHMYITTTTETSNTNINIDMIGNTNINVTKCDTITNKHNTRNDTNNKKHAS